MSSAAAVTGVDFEAEVLRSEIPVLVDFWAPWCPPCRALAPTLETIAQEYQGRVKIVKLDIDENHDVSDQYGVRSIPTLIVFKGGQKVKQMVGAYPKPAITQMLDDVL